MASLEDVSMFFLPVDIVLYVRTYIQYICAPSINFAYTVHVCTQFRFPCVICGACDHLEKTCRKKAMYHGEYWTFRQYVSGSAYCTFVRTYFNSTVHTYVLQLYCTYVLMHLFQLYCTYIRISALLYVHMYIL